MGLFGDQFYHHVLFMVTRPEIGILAVSGDDELVIAAPHDFDRGACERHVARTVAQATQSHAGRRFEIRQAALAEQQLERRLGNIARGNGRLHSCSQEEKNRQGRGKEGPNHHSGKDEARGARGSSALRAAVDTEIQIADGKISNPKQRDHELQPVREF